MPPPLTEPPAEGFAAIVRVYVLCVKFAVTVAAPAPIVNVVGFDVVLDKVPAVFVQLLNVNPVDAVAVNCFFVLYDIEPPAVTVPPPDGETAVVSVYVFAVKLAVTVAADAGIVKVVGLALVVDRVPAVLVQLVKWYPVPAVAVNWVFELYDFEPPAVTVPLPLGETAVVRVYVLAVKFAVTVAADAGIVNVVGEEDVVDKVPAVLVQLVNRYPVPGVAVSCVVEP